MVKLIKGMYCEKGRSIIRVFLIVEPQRTSMQLHEFYFFLNTLGFVECEFFGKSSILKSSLCSKNWHSVFNF